LSQEWYHQAAEGANCRLDGGNSENDGKEEHKKDVIGKPKFVEVPPPLVSKELTKHWSYFIRKVYETDPLACPKCRGEMWFIGFIGQPEVIIHTKGNSLAHELSPTQEAINASFNCVL